MTWAQVWSNAVESMKSPAGFDTQAAHPVPVSFFSISEVYPPKLKTEEKRLHLTLENVDLYNRAIQEAGLLVPDGALYLVDLHHLTSGGRPRALSAPQNLLHILSI